MGYSILKLALVTLFSIQESKWTKSIGKPIAKVALVALMLGHVKYARSICHAVYKPTEVVFVEILMFVLLEIVSFNEFHSLASKLDVQ